jgi:hypothetical protein
MRASKHKAKSSAVRAKEDQPALRRRLVWEELARLWWERRHHDQARTRGRDEEAGQMSRASRWRTSGTESRQHGRSSGRRRWSRESWGAPLGCTHPGKVGQRQQHKRDVAVPASEAADFIVIQPKVCGVGKILFDMPSGSKSWHHLLQGGSWGSEHKVVALLSGIRETATDEEPVASILLPLVQDGHSLQRHQSLGPFVPSLIERRCQSCSLSKRGSTSRTSTRRRGPSGVRIPTGSSQATAST